VAKIIYIPLEQPQIANSFVEHQQKCIAAKREKVSRSVEGIPIHGLAMHEIATEVASPCPTRCNGFREQHSILDVLSVLNKLLNFLEMQEQFQFKQS
jgi:hypothetical protein